MNEAFWNHKKIFIIGAAGFIGSTVARYLLDFPGQFFIAGIDNLNDYYDVSLKQNRISRLQDERFRFIKGDICDAAFLEELFQRFHPDIVIHMAAQAGVRYSLENPQAFLDANVNGFFHVLEMCRRYPVQHLLFASSSSVYGEADHYPSAEDDSTDLPVSFYAATKKSGEVMAHSYAAMYGIPITGMRFFTVYGPWGRPDMAYYRFAEGMKNGEDIPLFNYGDCKRDFTYIDDCVEGIIRLCEKAPELPVPFEIYNIGKGSPNDLMDFVRILHEEMVNAGLVTDDYDLESHIRRVPPQPGDVRETYADTRKLQERFGYQPQTDLRTGLHWFAEWYGKRNR